MSIFLVNAYIYENLKEIYAFCKTTRLCVYEPTGKLFVLKSVGLAQKASYEALLALNNPHLAKILYVAETADRAEVVCEYISGDTLADLIRGGRCLTSDTAVRIAADICDGLSDMHRLGYVHRDINPNNIIVSSDGHAVIIDYGIARCFSQGKNTDTVILGTPGYAAPEQFGFSQSDARTDIYAVGVLLNVMLTGKFPNEKKAQNGLGRVIDKCIEIDLRQRYHRIDDLKNALSRKNFGNGPMDRVVRQIPGIRNQYTIVVILAVIGYLFVILMTVGVFSAVKNGAYLQTIVAWLMCFAVPFFCFHNILGIWDRLPFSRGASKRTQRIAYISLGVMSILCGLAVFVRGCRRQKGKRYVVSVLFRTESGRHRKYRADRTVFLCLRQRNL